MRLKSKILHALSVSVKWLAVKTASEMTYIVSGGALNSTHSLSMELCWFVVGVQCASLKLFDFKVTNVHM